MALGNSWTRQSSLPAGTNLPALAAGMGRLWSIGGLTANSAASLSAVYSAPIMGDGTLGVWSVARDVPVLSGGMTAWVLNGYLYAYGGFDSGGGTVSSAVYRAKIHGAGRLDPWIAHTRTASLTGSYYSFASVFNNTVYAGGGSDLGGALINFSASSIDSNGNMSTWQTIGSLNQPIGITYGGVLGDGQFWYVSSASRICLQPLPGGVAPTARIHYVNENFIDLSGEQPTSFGNTILCPTTGFSFVTSQGRLNTKVSGTIAPNDVTSRTRTYTTFNGVIYGAGGVDATSGLVSTAVFAKRLGAQNEL